MEQRTFFAACNYYSYLRGGMTASRVTDTQGVRSL
jgi:hypothetical protein